MKMEKWRKQIKELGVRRNIADERCAGSDWHDPDCVFPLYFTNQTRDARNNILEMAAEQGLTDVVEMFQSVCVVCIYEHPEMKPHVPWYARKIIKKGIKVFARM